MTSPHEPKLDQLTAEEVDKVRSMLEHFSFPKSEGGAEAGPGHGGDVKIQPGLRGETEGTLDGRIVMHNPGGSTRPFLTLVDGEDELDVFLGKEGPGNATGDSRVGSIYLEYGGGGRPLKVHRRERDGWVWPKWAGK